MKVMFDGKFKIKKFPSYSCNCYQKKFDAIESRERQQRINDNFKNSMMSEAFKTAHFNKYQTCNFPQNKQVCIDYYKNFKPGIREGLFLIGSPGTGKTELLACITNNLIKDDYVCIFADYQELIDRSFNDKTVLNKLNGADFVVIDDFGRHDVTKDFYNDFMFKLVNFLYRNNKNIGITINPDILRELKRINKNNAAIDRLYEMCKTVLRFDGKSYRRE